MRFRAYASVAIALLGGLLAVQQAAATHSLPATPSYIDADNDGHPDAATILRTAGNNSLWTSAREDRVTHAASQWRAYSQFDPSVNLTAAPADCYDSWTCHGVWIDGQVPDPFEPTDLAINFRKLILRETGPLGNETVYWDIEDWDIFFNTSIPGHPQWTYALNHPGDSNVFDFQGVLTHELGHSIHLKDLSGGQECNFGPGMYTMCGSVNGYPDSYRMRTITNDDISGANFVY